MAKPYSIVDKILIVPGLPQPWLAPKQSPAWQKLHDSFKSAQESIADSDADLILYYSTQWLSVLGYTFQADPNPEWVHVDHNFHDLGSLPYKFKVDADFAKIYAEEVKKEGHNARLVNHRGFPVDTGTIIAQNFLNPGNRLPAAMVSCNMYAEKQETVGLGQATARALERAGKRAILVLVSSLSQRFFVHDIDPREDRISSAKDDEWNRKICELLGEGRLEDVAQVARDFAREANGDMGFKGIWWLSGATGEHNDFKGEVFDYQPIHGSGAAIAALTPTRPIRAPKPAPKAGAVQNAAAASEPVQTGSAIVNAAEAPEPVGAYPHARREGEFLFLSGVGPRARGKKEIPGVTLDAQGNITAYDVEIQTRSVIDNVKAILAASGSSLEQVVDVQVFLTNMKKDFPIFNRIYAEHFGAIQATRTTIEVNRLPTPIAVEFKVIAKV